MSTPGIHWREYVMETFELGLFMICALAITTTMEHPASPVRQLLGNALTRRALTGVAMGLTAAAIIYSPLGRRSGAHFNPSVTLTFLRLGKIAPRDAFFYVIAQFVGAIAGVALVAALVRNIIGDPTVNYVATVPGRLGLTAAFAGEAVISFGMMSMVLLVSNTPRIEHATGILAACLIAIYITIEAPLSGMSMNPARSFGPALAAGTLQPLWIYFSAPPIGMLLAAELYVRRYGYQRVRCAKLHHPSTGPCHFGCNRGREENFS